MTRLMWHGAGDKVYETGLDRGVLYVRGDAGGYEDGEAWNGLTTVTESPSGAESNKQYADNTVYLNLRSAEEFGGTIEAFTYPDSFEECDGTRDFGGVSIGQQTRKSFGFAYRTLVGDDIKNTEAGYKLHLVYGADANPSEKSRTTMNDSPEATTFSWEFTTIPVGVGVVEGVDYKPTSKLTIDSRKVPADVLSAIEDILYGTVGADPRLPLPGEVISMVSGQLTQVETTGPTYNAATDMITIPATTGVVYKINGEVVSGEVGPITGDTVVNAEPAEGYKFSPESDTDWTVNFS